jgi:prephenate dehydratase
MIIGILGPQGTYSQKAAKQWNEKATIQFYDDIFDTVDALLKMK